MSKSQNYTSPGLYEILSNFAKSQIVDYVSNLATNIIKGYIIQFVSNHILLCLLILFVVVIVIIITKTKQIVQNFVYNMIVTSSICFLLDKCKSYIIGYFIKYAFGYLLFIIQINAGCIVLILMWQFIALNFELISSSC